ncbi:tetratricopeptide repeat protein [Clostridium lundense]|uniref:tetratricopeptide repeat protein n=1 Tax=Clostridium lundense TaxID=319475 RepID=UPI00047F3F5E|nr:tetratricopeptide repeat protein [Clostridium lundense]
MDKSSKLYNKALEKYNKGYIDKAEEICEKSISLNINNSASINLKGLLYYINGDLDNCRKLWKMNFQINKDRVSDKYLQDTKDDQKLLELYNTALILIKELKINEALILLRQCEKSHFNYINVNNNLALCYIKKGNYIKALEHLDNVLKADNKNKIALESKKNLRKYNCTKRQINLKNISLTAICVFLVFGIGILIKINSANISKSLKSSKNKIMTSIHKKNSDSDKTKSNTDNVALNKQNNEEKSEKSKNEVFPYNEIKKHIDEKDFNKIHNDLIKWNNKDLSINEKSLLGQGKDLINSAGGEYFYNKGYEFLTKGDHNNTRVYLERAYEYGNGKWYYPHAIYLLGTTYQNLGDMENAIRYYSSYDNRFNNDEYEEIVLYNLALLYKNIDMNKAKAYGKKLVKSFPESIYNNTNIQNLIAK